MNRFSENCHLGIRELKFFVGAPATEVKPHRQLRLLVSGRVSRITRSRCLRPQHARTHTHIRTHTHARTHTHTHTHARTHARTHKIVRIKTELMFFPGRTRGLMFMCLPRSFFHCCFHSLIAHTFGQFDGGRCKRVRSSQ